MKDDESIPEIFYRLQVIVNDLKSLGEKVKDEDVTPQVLSCLILHLHYMSISIIHSCIISMCVLLA
jgi:hypothetical protein